MRLHEDPLHTDKIMLLPPLATTRGPIYPTAKGPLLPTTLCGVGALG